MGSLGMTVEKHDLLSECNDQGVPLEDFRLQFCDHCLNRDCARSQAGKSKFEQRTVAWEDRLFNEVPQLDPEDPRVEAIQAKRFLEASPKGPHEAQSSWDDPRDLTESSEPSEPPEVTEPPEVAAFSQIAASHIRQNLEDEQLARLTDPVEQAPLPEPVETTPEVPAQVLGNTPKQPGQMIGGKKIDKRATSPVLDPWEPKKTSTDDDAEVIQPGARVRMGGSGV